MHAISRSTKPALLLAAVLLAGSLAEPVARAAEPKAKAPAASAAKAKPATTLAAPGPRAADPTLGQGKAESERCLECHGPQGQGDGVANGAPARFAKLAGQPADYLVQQLQAFRNGKRKNDLMKIMTLPLEEEDLRDIAAFFAQQPPMHGTDPGATESHDAARTLFAQGDAARGITACASCHGEAGQGGPPGGPLVPRLAGQDVIYLAQQLEDWRTGWRTEAAGSVSHQKAKALTPTEINALAAYLAAQP
jgi:cytochrome c553